MCYNAWMHFYGEMASYTQRDAIRRYRPFMIDFQFKYLLLSAKVVNKSEKKKDFLEKFSIFFEESNYCTIFAV